MKQKIKAKNEMWNNLLNKVKLPIRVVNYKIYCKNKGIAEISEKRLSYQLLLLNIRKKESLCILTLDLYN